MRMTLEMMLMVIMMLTVVRMMRVTLVATGVLTVTIL